MHFVSLPHSEQVAQHVLRGHLYRRTGETHEMAPTEPGIMDLMAEIKLAGDYKKGTAAPVWLKGGNVLNGHHAELAAPGAGGRRRGGRAQQQGDSSWPEDELGDNNVRDLADLQVCACHGVQLGDIPTAA